ncbi:MAG: zinc ribbon domain-containing protein [Anaerolineales bacterium]
MRDCPNCSQQIQDEAVYCRHCHTELEPPLWLTSMQRCPYCAEWIENDLERCKYCDRSLGAQQAAPFVDISSAPEDRLRQSLLDDDSDEAAAIADAAAEFVAEEPSVPPAGFDADQHQESALDDIEPEPSIYDEPQSDLRRSLYDQPPKDEFTEEPSTYYGPGDEAIEYVEPPAADSSIWMAGAAAEEQEGTGLLAEGSDDFGRSIAGTEGVSDLRSDVSGPPGRIRRTAGKLARIVIIVVLLGAVTWSLFAIAQGPLGAAISEALATDVPTDTPIPEPTSTRRPAPTLPPVTEESAIVPTEVGGLTSEPECVLWDAITLDDEGAEICAYGVIKRWWAGEDIPFIAIFSEEASTFAIIDRTTRHPVGPGSCILARGTVEIMGGVRPNIDAQGVLEPCPEGLVEG